MGGDGQNKGRGRGPPCSEEERKHARQVNAARVAEGLASKSAGSVSRSKARALAHRASIDSKFIPGEVIGPPPAVRPPPPPKAPTRAPVVLLEAQPRSGGSSPQHEGPSDSEGKGKDKRTKQGEVFLKDKRELEATSSSQPTESDEGGAVLASSSTTPWQRRVRLRIVLEAKDKTREPCPVEGAGDVGMAEASEHPTRPRCSQGGGAPELHGWQQSGVPKKAMPKTLEFKACPSGPCGTLLQWLAKGQDRAAYTCQGTVFKISELPQFPELRLSRRFPGVVAKVF